MHATQCKTPHSTYRLQLNHDFTFAQACALVPYLRQLGISHLYISPCLKASPGSMHGYDVVDPSEVNPELGGRAGFQRLCEVLSEHEMGLVVDIVPNHMAIVGRSNRWWWDVLINGRSSRYAQCFDIRWDHPDPKLKNKVLLPILGDDLQRCVESRQIRVRKRGQEVYVAYFDHEMPVSSSSWAQILAAAAESAGGKAPVGSTGAALFTAGDAAVDAAITAVNEDPARLQQFLDQQHYRLAFWRNANRDVNYRRFFDIHQLVGVCVENRQVFDAVHKLVLRWVKEGQVEGVRIDHPDGLSDPTQYIQRLRESAPSAWIVVEKILEPGETLRREWPVAGTTGYDFLNMLVGLFVDPAGETPLTNFYREFTGQSIDFDEVVREKKMLVLDKLFISEMDHLTDLMVESLDQRPGAPQCRRLVLHQTLAVLIACFPVYRTYIRPEATEPGPEDRVVVREAIMAAALRPDIDGEALRWIEDLLLLRRTGEKERDFVQRFQQLTGPAMAKGVEDTAFYCFNRLTALNEVGGNPGGFGISLNAFHGFCARIASDWPKTMLASATHDTKRGEDARLRIALLAEMPGRWTEAVRRWSSMNARFRRNGLPDANSEYLLYQTLVGTWPIGSNRLASYILKAARESKVHTSWTDPDPVYEENLKGFVEGVLEHADFTEDLEAFLKPMTRPAMIASLAQTLIKCTAPGVPDIYQGSELDDLSLVDPDNRRPVDFDLRQRLITEIETLSVEEILQRAAEGLPKLFVLKRVLATRHQVAEAFGPQGDYRPLAAEGRRAGHLVGFARGGLVLTLVPRLAVALNDDWRDTTVTLPPGIWSNAFTGERCSGGPLKLARMTTRFPVLLLVRKD